jgi:hypothetical protein
VTFQSRFSANPFVEPDVNTEMNLSRVVHNFTAQRFELLVEGQTAFCRYSNDGNQIIFDHTYVPNAFRGKGVGANLVRAALDEVRRQHWKIVPRCSFVAAFIEQNPEYADLVDRQE